jgi:hypothetical protein
MYGALRAPTSNCVALLTQGLWLMQYRLRISSAAAAVYYLSTDRHTHGHTHGQWVSRGWIVVLRQFLADLMDFSQLKRRRQWGLSGTVQQFMSSGGS